MNYQQRTLRWHLDDASRRLPLARTDAREWRSGWIVGAMVFGLIAAMVAI